MKATIQINNPRLKPFEAIDIQVIIENNTTNKVLVPRYLGYTPFFNGENKESTTGQECIEKYKTDNLLLPNQSIVYSFRQSLELCLIEKKKDIATVEFKLTIRMGENTESIVKNLEVDFTDFVNLISKENTASHYYSSDNVIFYYSPYSRAYEPAIKILKGAVKNYTVISENYIIDDKKVYNNGRLVKTINSKGFKIYNALFAGNKDSVLTAYGNAKAENPATFKVLDDGLTPSQFASQNNGYKCSYAVDSQFAYYFDTATDTRHATRIKACKNPQTLESLGFAYAKDDKNVYFAGKKINKANPKTFSLINRHYSTDGKHLFHHNNMIDKADLASFEILPTIAEENSPDPILNSHWAKDKNHYFEHGMAFPETKEAYYAHLQST